MNLNRVQINFYTIQPPPDLRDYIQFFWVLEGSSSEQQPFVHRALADCSPELIFYYKGYFKLSSDIIKSERTFTSGIYGQSQQFKKLEATTDFGIFGVYLYPYSIPELFSLPASEISEQMPDLKTLCGKEGEILEENIILAGNNLQRVLLLSEFIKTRLKKSKRNDLNLSYCIKKLLHNKEEILIPSLANDCNLSRRQFERIFKEKAGFSPKTFLNLVRFNSILNEFPKQSKSFTQITYDYEFYDQPHFIKTFIRFSGYTPKEYFRQKNLHGDYRASVEFK